MPERIQLRRTKGWRKPADAIVVARPTKWGNQYVPVRTLDGPHRFGILLLGKPFPLLSSAEGADRYDDAIVRCIEQYRWSILRWIEDEYGEEDVWRPRALSELTGRDLCCWCPLDHPCHADVLLELANEPNRAA